MLFRQQCSNAVVSCISQWRTNAHSTKRLKQSRAQGSVRCDYPETRHHYERSGAEGLNQNAHRCSRPGSSHNSLFCAAAHASKNFTPALSYNFSSITSIYCKDIAPTNPPALHLPPTEVTAGGITHTPESRSLLSARHTSCHTLKVLRPHSRNVVL